MFNFSFDFFLILAPHLVWLVENDYVTLTYAINRTGIEEKNFLNHLTNPAIFLVKQIGILLPFFVIFLFSISKFKKKLFFNLKSKKMLLRVSQSAKKVLLLNGMHTEWGARPIRRIIQDDIENVISYKFLTNKIGENSTIFITGKGDQLIFKSKANKLFPKKNKSQKAKSISK